MTAIVTRYMTGAVAALLLTAGHQAQAGLAAHWEESGLASWYGAGFEGHRTSSGEIFSPHALTAAHDSLPLGTRILVTTQETGRSVVVTITDRMPTKRLRVIDLSRAAARELGIVNSGTGMVTLTEAKNPPLVEVAEATEDAISPPPHGPRHTRHAARTVSGHRSYYPARSAIPARR